MVKIIDGVNDLQGRWRGQAAGSLEVTLQLQAGSGGELQGTLTVRTPGAADRSSRLVLTAQGDGALALEYPDDGVRLHGAIDGRKIQFVAPEAREVWTVLGARLEVQVFTDPRAGEPFWCAQLERC